MIVYCVLYGDFEGQFLNSIWSTREKAQERADAQTAAEKITPDASHGYYVEEFEIDNPDYVEGSGS